MYMCVCVYMQRDRYRDRQPNRQMKICIASSHSFFSSFTMSLLLFLRFVFFAMLDK